ncbi:hypothetical protein ACBJ59_11040 [Nonomuraea sp. MTCD27]|uniref:hypothetical protein n=1 Tax=Nonomuraea sp. MTCD27 TaxID=1676747 RepID=UPI0035C0B6B9
MAHVVRLRRTKFDKRAAELGLLTQVAQADAIGVHVSIHNRVLTGKTEELSGPYVVGILWAFGDDSVRDFLRQYLDIELDAREPVAS